MLDVDSDIYYLDNIQDCLPISSSNTPADIHDDSMSLTLNEEPSNS